MICNWRITNKIKNSIAKPPIRIRRLLNNADLNQTRIHDENPRGLLE